MGEADVRTGTVLSVVLIPLMVAACDVGTTDPPPLYFEWEGQFVAAAGWEHLEGQAAFGWVEGADQLTAAVELMGDEPGEERAWRLRHSTCAQGGATLGSDADYPPLQIHATGIAQVVTTVPVGIEHPEAAYHVIVFVSAEDTDTAIACGDMVLVAAF
jgi:hypothetical protein